LAKTIRSEFILNELLIVEFNQLFWSQISSVSTPLREKYFIILHEILFHLLDMTVEKKGLFKPHLLPIIAHLLMKLSLSMDRSPSTDWAFWRMAKVCQVQ
jgi:hypothetical protein